MIRTGQHCIYFCESDEKFLNEKLKETKLPISELFRTMLRGQTLEYCKAYTCRLLQSRINELTALLEVEKGKRITNLEVANRNQTEMLKWNEEAEKYHKLTEIAVAKVNELQGQPQSPGNGGQQHPTSPQRSPGMRSRWIRRAKVNERGERCWKLEPLDEVPDPNSPVPLPRHPPIPTPQPGEPDDDDDEESQEVITNV